MLVRVIFLFGLLATAYSLIALEDDASAPSRDNRIMGGAIIRHNAMASVRTAMLQGNFHICGGFVINNFFVGTAAQCVFDRTASNTIVGVGTNLITATITYSLGNIFTNPLFNSETKANDIALLRTLTPIEFTPTITSIALDFSEWDRAENVDIFGWGRSTAGGNLQNSLLRGVFRIAPLATCRNNFPVVMRNLILDSHICTAWAGRATCPGDAGGPIIFSNRVVGIVSWVEPCVGGQTNVNTRISSYFEWIVSVVSSG